MSSSSQVPKEVLLDESRKTIVGRCFPETDVNNVWVTLNSPKVPGMLSKTHSVLAFDKKHRQWTVEDLKSVNGVYVNNNKLESSIPQVLKEGDEVCFGTAISKNVFKYTFVSRDGKHLLSRKRKRTCLQVNNSDSSQGTGNSTVGVVHPSDTDVLISQNSETIQDLENDVNLTPPMRKTSRLQEEGVAANSSGLPSAVQVLDEQPPISLKDEKKTGATTSEPQLVSHTIITSQQCQNSRSLPPVTYATVPTRASLSKPSSSSTVLHSHQSSPSSLPAPSCSTSNTTPIAAFPSPSASVSSHSVKPSPAISFTSYTSTATEVDDLFDSIVKQSDSVLLDEAIFGGNEPPKSCGQTSGENLDGATIQVMMAKNEMEQEKHNLLCSIEALKSELAAKNDMITKKEDDEKASKEGVVASMKEEFTCVICQELFIRPHTLPCSHTFCEWCIKNWFKCQKLECPICRVKTISQPVKSIVLDNAIAMLEGKLSESEKEEREKMKKEHKQFLQKHHPGPVVVKIERPPTMGASENPIVLNETSESGTSESESESDSDDSAETYDSDEDSSRDYYHGGYGGYGRCYNCGERGHWRPQCPYH